MGAAFVVGGIVRLAALSFAPYLLAPTQLRPEWLTPSAVADAAAAIAAGAVLVRAGSTYALLLYLTFELLRIVAGIPGRLIFCERAGLQGFGAAGAQPIPGVTCNVPSMLLGEWPTVAALALGAVLAPALLSSSGDGANRMLRAAGAFALIATVSGMALGITPQWSSLDQQFTLTNLMTVVQLIAGVVAGVLLARAPLAAALLIVLLLIGLPAALEPASTQEPAEFTTMRWAAVYMPVLAGVAILAARGYVRRRRGSSFFLLAAL
jgi:hypothetical protein